MADLNLLIFHHFDVRLQWCLSLAYGNITLHLVYISCTNAVHGPSPVKKMFQY